MIVPIMFTGSVVVVPCFLSVELGWADASSAISTQPSVTISFFIVRLLLLMVCSAEGVSGAGEHSTRATSRISNSPVSATLVRSKTLKRRDLVRANLLVDPGNETPCMRAVCVVIISKLRIQQVLFCIDARQQRGNKQHCEKHTDSRTKSQAPSQ